MAEETKTTDIEKQAAEESARIQRRKEQGFVASCKAAGVSDDDTRKLLEIYRDGCDKKIEKIAALRTSIKAAYDKAQAAAEKTGE